MFISRNGMPMLLGLAALTLAAPQAHAQAAYYRYSAYTSVYRYPPTYTPLYRYSSGDTYGGFLQGAAAAIEAQGRYELDHQGARLAQEQVRQAQIETHRRQVEWWLWKRDNLPTLADEQERARREQVRQAQTNPPLTEILSGKSLNDLLHDVQILQGRGFAGPSILLDENMVRRLNVLVAGAAGNAGLLKVPELPWPLLFLQERFQEDRDRLDALMAQARRQASSGNVRADTVKELLDALERLDQKLRTLARAVRDEDWRPSEFVRANRFVTEVREAARALREPGAADYVTGKCTAQGKTVAELVQHMTEQGLRFAPAVGGNDASYVGLHRALASYDLALQAAAAAPSGGSCSSASARR
jgi:hypothetical protein